MRQSKLMRVLAAAGLVGAIALGGVACADDGGTGGDTGGATTTGGDTGGTTTGTTGGTSPSPVMSPTS